MSSLRNIAAQLERIAGEFVQAVQEASGELPTAPRESAWRSECIHSAKNSELVFWRPVRRRDHVDFSGLERALELPFPAELRAFYSHFWSGSITVGWEERNFELLQLWNREDEDNLMHNFLGHALEKKRAREALTLFFGVVDDARFLSCDVATGAVMLEEVGGSKPQQVAEGLEDLLTHVVGCAAPGADR